MGIRAIVVVAIGFLPHLTFFPTRSLQVSSLQPSSLHTGRVCYFSLPSLAWQWIKERGIMSIFTRVGANWLGANSTVNLSRSEVIGHLPALHSRFAFRVTEFSLLTLLALISTPTCVKVKRSRHVHAFVFRCFVLNRKVATRSFVWNYIQFSVKNYIGGWILT